MTSGLNLIPFLKKSSVLLFLLCLGIYAYFYQAGGANQNSRFDLVRSMVEDHKLDINRFHENTIDKAKRGENYYSDKAPGASWLGLPVYAAFRLLPGSRTPNLDFLSSAHYAATILAVSIPSALAVVMLYLLGKIFEAGRGFSLLIALGYGLGTLAFPYSTHFMGHQLAAALLLIGFGLLIKMKYEASTNWKTALLSGAVLGYAVITEYTALLAVAIMGLYILFSPSIRKYFPVWALGGLPSLLLMMVYNQAAFGGPLTLAYEFSTMPHRHLGYFMGLGIPSLKSAYHFLLSAHRGLFYSAPWLFFGLAGSVLMILKKRFKAEAIVCLSVFAVFVWMNASLVDWDGGWTFGARYLVPAIPFLALSAYGLSCHIELDKHDRFFSLWKQLRNGYRFTVFLLLIAVIFSVFMMLIATAVGPDVPKRTEPFMIRGDFPLRPTWPFQEFLWPCFFNGKLAVNIMSIAGDIAKDPAVFYAWNLGQQLGLQGLSSLIPLGIFTGFFLIAITLAIFRERKEEDSWLPELVSHAKKTI